MANSQLLASSSHAIAKPVGAGYQRSSPAEGLNLGKNESGCLCLPAKTLMAHCVSPSELKPHFTLQQSGGQRLGRLFRRRATVGVRIYGVSGHALESIW